LSDREMNDTLMRLGLQGTSLTRITAKGAPEGEEYSGARLRELLELLVKLEDFSTLLRKRGIEFRKYVSQWNEERGSLPSYAVLMDGELHYFHDDDELMAFSAEQTKRLGGEFTLIT